MHLHRRERRRFILQGFGTTQQSVSHRLQQTVQQCFVLLLEQVDDMSFARAGNGIRLAMTMLESALLRLHAFELCDSISNETSHSCRGKAVFASALMERLLHVVSAIEGVIHTHEVDIRNVIHEQKEFGLRSRRLRDELVHSLQRRHCRSVLGKVALELAGELSPRAQQLKQHRRVCVCEVERREYNKRSVLNIQCVALVAHVPFGSICVWHVLRADEHLAEGGLEFFRHVLVARKRFRIEILNRLFSTVSCI